MTLKQEPEPGPQPDRRSKSKIKLGITPGGIFRGVNSLLLIAALSLGVYYFITHYFIKDVKVVGVSMVPTLAENDKYLLELYAFRSRNPVRNDIVVIHDPGDGGYAVKRIVALPGETVHFKDGKVYVNGEKLNEPYLMANVRTFTYSQAKEQLITCGNDQYFVLGDNRPASIDSRSYGPVNRKDILGLVLSDHNLPL
jgi:signal peptidase I